MNSILTVFTQNILPIFVVAGFGFALRRWLKLDKQALSGLAFNCFSPCLVFFSLVTSQLGGDEIVELTLFTLLSIAAAAGLGLLAGALFGLSRQDRVALLLLLMFVNGGNFGLTLNQLRYGSDGVARAVVYFTVSTLVTFTAGLFIASMGRLSLREAGRRLLRLPGVYAAVAAVVVYNLQIPVPGALMKGIEVAAAGAIPVLLIVLGMQMADLRGRLSSRLAIPAIGVRLLLGPVVGVVVAFVLGLQGLTRSTSILQASMPPAVFNIILATEFDLSPTTVTGIVVVSTLLSPLTLAALITLLGL